MASWAFLKSGTMSTEADPTVYATLALLSAF
jgi:hypothetical protein